MIYSIVLIFYLIMKYLQWNFMFQNKFQKNIFLDELFSIFFIIFLFWFLYYWTLFNKKENGTFTEYYFVSLIIIIFLIIFYVFKVIVLRKNNINYQIKIFFLITSNFIELLIFMLIGIDIFQ